MVSGIALTSGSPTNFQTKCLMARAAAGKGSWGLLCLSWQLGHSNEEGWGIRDRVGRTKKVKRVPDVCPTLSSGSLWSLTELESVSRPGGEEK